MSLKIWGFLGASDGAKFDFNCAHGAAAQLYAVQAAQPSEADELLSLKAGGFLGVSDRRATTRTTTRTGAHAHGLLLGRGHGFMLRLGSVPRPSRDR